uniref:Uncharacterized protein n=1 Tax=Timema bartmani TaxID=61472 RepID=A0A7R9HY43_9NEOP|nr:unnamed protein product [Timema bartmani]
MVWHIALSETRRGQIDGECPLNIEPGVVCVLSEVCATAGRRKAEGRPACSAASDEDRLPGAQRLERSYCDTQARRILLRHSGLKGPTATLRLEGSYCDTQARRVFLRHSG